jgi:hypothetical protein
MVNVIDGKTRGKKKELYQQEWNNHETGGLASETTPKPANPYYEEPRWTRTHLPPSRMLRIR